MPINFKLLILERLFAQEDANHELASALDAKGSYMLIVQTVIVGLLVDTFKGHHGILWIVFGGIATLLLITSVIQTLLLLKNRLYSVDGAVQLRSWYLDTMKYYEENHPEEYENKPEEIEEAILDSLIKESTTRIEANKAHNETKADHYECAFVTAIMSLAAFVLALIIPALV